MSIVHEVGGKFGTHQMVISSAAAGFVEGKNQKKSSRVSLGELEIGNSPAYDSPMSKGTSGMPEPFTMNSGLNFSKSQTHRLSRCLALSVLALMYGEARFSSRGLLNGFAGSLFSSTGFLLANLLSTF